MTDYLMREDAPLDQDGWANVDGMVVDVIKKNLVGRRFMTLVGPLGWGVEQAPLFGFEEEAGAYVASGSTRYLPLTEIREEFLLRAKHLAMVEQTRYDLDLGAVAMAATKLANREDEIVIGGLVEQAENVSELGVWDKVGKPFATISQAVATLRSDGFDGPYAAVMNPGMYARLAGLMRHGQRELEMVKRLLEGGLYQSTMLDDDLVMVVSPHEWNFDLVVGQDVSTAYLGNEGLDHRFRIFETLALRVKRPGAVHILR